MKRFIAAAGLGLAALFALAITGTAQQISSTFSLDSLCTTQGSVLYRGASAWLCRTPGTAGQVLSTNGAGADPAWIAAGGTGTVTSVATSGGIIGGTITTTGTLNATGGEARGRCTLTSGTPVLTSTVSAAGTVYFTPYRGNLAPIYDGTNMVMTSFSELSNVLANSATGNAGPAAAVASKVYDIFVWNDSGTVKFTRGPKWDDGTGGSNTVRGTGAGSTEIQWINGIPTNKIAITNGPAANRGTYVCTVATDASGGTVTWQPGSANTTGQAAFLNVWNMWNRVDVVTTVIDTTSSWTYGSTTPRSARNITDNRVTFVQGLTDAAISGSAVVHTVSGTTGTPIVGFCLDVTNAFTGIFTGGASGQVQGNANGAYSGNLLGSHFLQWCEAASTAVSQTFNNAAAQSGIVVRGRF